MCKERFINPFTDFGFKRLFGTPGNEKSLISILNAIINDDDKITEITYLPTEKLGMGQESRVAIFDLYCITQSGSHMIVEMQNNYQEFFVDRSVYYSTFPIQEAVVKGKWDYHLPKVYTIAFLNFEIRQAHVFSQLQKRSETCGCGDRTGVLRPSDIHIYRAFQSSAKISVSLRQRWIGGYTS